MGDEADQAILVALIPCASSLIPPRVMPYERARDTRMEQSRERRRTMTSR
jgi:hypothetical protein